MKKFADLSHLFVTVFLSGFSTFVVAPAITDVTMSALCPGKDECSLAIYLTGFQQAIIGLGTLVMMPVLGNLSDGYGRKAVLTVPLTLSILPLVILAYSRTTAFFYAYYVLKTLTAMICEGSVPCLALAYVADIIPEGQRASAFGILGGVASASFVTGNLAARFLSTSVTFQAAAFLAVVATVYMRIFLKESIIDDASARASLLKTSDVICSDDGSSKKIQVFKNVPSVEDMVCLLKNSLTFAQVAIVAFFSSLADGAVHASLMYYFKAQFHFSKNQFADFMMILGVSATISQLLLMPIFTPCIGELKLLSLGLFVSCTHFFLYSIAWSNWVLYATAVSHLVTVCVNPCIRSIASKQVGPNEQGKAQGCISGICSFANIVSPLIFSPLTALFLSERAPFHFPGFSIMCIGFASMIAFILSTMVRAVPPISCHKLSNGNYAEA